VHSDTGFFIVCRIEDIRLVKSPVKHFEVLFKKGRRVHLIFCVALFLLIAFIFYVERAWHFLQPAIFYYLFTLCCIYTGRWIWKEWLATKRWFQLLLTVIVILIIYDAIGVIGYVIFFLGALSAAHTLETSVNTLVIVVLLVFFGFFNSVIRTAIRENVNGMRLAEQNKASELSLLRSQVSPHFLFNTLNNMYSLSINQPSKMPALLLKLSDLLRYSVYEAGQPLVGLEEELTYIRNYIELESIRSSDRLLLTLSIGTPSVPAKIVPMILIVFVENAFKHARNTLEQKIEIAVDLKLENGFIFFNVLNSCTEGDQEGMAGIRHSGFGVDNVVKRMELLYPGEYSLKQERQQDHYKVELRLKVK